jgi:prepilin-type N-terminal cleavage/methylation domain-containing protein
MKKCAGFTLVELMLAVAIVADIAIIALPTYTRARRASQNARFCSDLRIAAAAFEMYAAENNRYPAETAPGVVPAGMPVYLKGLDFGSPNTLGATWDWDYNQGYAIAAICVDLPTDADTIQMLDIDSRIDNGILATGAFRERSARRYAYIIE